MSAVILQRYTGFLTMKPKNYQKPDDCFSCGPIEMARFGRFCVMRNRMTPKGFEEFQQALIKRFPDVCTEIDAKVIEVAALVAKYDPIEMLKRAYWEEAALHLGVESESELGHDASIAYRMLDYIQSIVESIPPNAEYTKPTDPEWEYLKSCVEKLFVQLNSEYQICRTAVNKSEAPDYDDAYEEYVFRSQTYWCNIRGQRYLTHEIQFFQEVLKPHDEVLRELFGIGVDDFITLLEGIHKALTIGISDAFAEFNEFRQATLQELEEKQKTHPILTEDEIPRLMHEIVVDRGWGDWQGSIIGRLFQEDLFDLQKTSGFSSNVLDALSWGVGEDLEFFSEGKFRGWPLRVWPVFKRPFLKINNHYYCFDLHGMYDHLYRALQRVILKNKPGYQETWNNKQKDISEKIPCDLLLRLLPGAQVYRNVFYPIQPEGGAPRQWGEVDAVLTYDDYLFVVEVKAGAFKLISPATDFPMYIRSLRDLVLTPAKQGERFLKYLASAEEVALFDSSHSEIKRVSYRDYRQNVILAVSLDPFTEYAAQVTHLKDIGVDVGASPVWSISVEDLTVYSDIFENPLVFLHFVEERLRASKSLQIKLDDELYHLGLYLKHNLYTEYAKQFNENEPMQWVGYAADIDRYYSRKASGIPDVHLPKQKTPKRIREINDILVKGTRPGRSRVVRALLNCDSYWREKIASGIDELLIEQARDMRPKSISTFVGEKISIYCWQEGVFDRNERFAIEHSQAAMIIRNDSERILIELFFDKNSSITDVCFKFLKLNSLSSFELEKVKELAESLKKARVSRERATTTIGRNDKCPCGSGRKYKKCCMDIC